MELVLPGRFTGPSGSANGGYAAGRIAEFLPEAATVVVTLRAPPPLDRALQVNRIDAGLHVVAGTVLVAEASPATLAGEPPPAVPYATAEAAAAAYAGRVAHPFPGCFVCGVDRPADDGLHLAPGPVPGRTGTVAAAWYVRETGRPLVWAALDCPGGWSIDLVGRPMVLGRITARVDAVPRPGERCVVVGERLRTEGRKSFTATALYAVDGALLGEARSVWIEVERSRPRP